MSTMISVGLLMPVSSYGQGGRTDGFFSNNGDYNNRDGEVEMSSGLTNESFGAPLGSGLLVFTAAGAGYVLIKKRRRRLNMIVVAALLLGMTQCKKYDTIMYDSNSVKITLDVAGDVKLGVNPETGAVTFEDGDEIIVANNGLFIGRLTYDEGIFSGTVLNPSTDDYLHFYHLGNAALPDLVEGSSTGCLFSIADQINGFPVVSYGHSSDKYSSSTTSYTAKLQNKCALVKFNVTTSSAFAATCITGMKNTVTVDFSDAGFTYDMVNDGKITLPSGSGERWAILLPQDEVEAGEDGSAFSGRYRGVRGAVPEIKTNDYHSDGVDVVMNDLTLPEGTLNGLFTIGVGKQVAFARSNLSYDIENNEWKFMDTQYKLNESISKYPGDNYVNLSQAALFCWGQTGYNHGAVSYLPYDTDSGQDNFYVYGDPYLNLYDQNGQADWGYVAISDGGNANKQWRTLTIDEWNYLFTQRPNADQKYGRALISNKYKGIVVLPDDWEAPYENCFVGGAGVACTDNKYTATKWRSMEAAGAMFLPYSGYRFNGFCTGSNNYGMVWSSSAYDGRQAYIVSFSESEYVFNRIYQRNAGLPVRLACE